MKSPLVSVVMPCLNGERFVASAVESVLGQTWKHLEVLVVDNGSSDASVELIEGFSDSRLRLLKCQRRGASAARNIGLNNAHGDLIQFLDADDLLAPDKIAIQVELLQSVSFDFIASGASARFEEDHTKAVFSPDPVWKHFGPQEYLLASWTGGGDIPVFAWLTPRKVINRAGLWNESVSFNDDREFFCRVILASEGIRFCPEARGYYRKVPGSLGTRQDANGYLSHFQTTLLCGEHLLKTEDSLRTRAAAADLLQNFIYDAFPSAPELVRLAEHKVRELGGSRLRPRESQAFSLVAGACGWKTAKRLQTFYRRLVYRRPSAMKRR